MNHPIGNSSKTGRNATRLVWTLALLASGVCAGILAFTYSALKDIQISKQELTHVQGASQALSLAYERSMSEIWVAHSSPTDLEEVRKSLTAAVVNAEEALDNSAEKFLLKSNQELILKWQGLVREKAICSENLEAQTVTNAKLTKELDENLYNLSVFQDDKQNQQLQVAPTAFKAAHEITDLRVLVLNLRILLGLLQSARSMNEWNEIKDHQIHAYMQPLEENLSGVDQIDPATSNTVRNSLSLVWAHVLGDGFLLDSTRQTITLGCEGLFNARRTRIELREKVDALDDEMGICEERLNAQRSILEQFFGNKYNQQARNSELVATNSWNRIFMLGLLGNLLFLLLVMPISRIIRRQVQQIEEFNHALGASVQTEKAQAASLRTSEERFRTLCSYSPLGIFRADPAGKLTYANERLGLIAGRPEKSLRKLGWEDLVAPQDRAVLRTAWLKALNTSINFECEFRILRPDQSLVWVSVRSHRIDGDSANEGHVGTVEDISQRKRSEDERMQMELKLNQAQKLESIGQLAAGIAHEINTPTQYVGDNVRFLQDAFNGYHEVVQQYRGFASAHAAAASSESLAALKAVELKADLEYLEAEAPLALSQALDGVSRISKIVGAMKEFSHPGSKEKTPTDINHAIETTSTVARNEWKYVAELTTDFDPGMPMVPCLPGEFNQVILNLIVNSAHAIGEKVKASGERGLISIKTRHEKDWCVIHISDTGNGIPDSIRHRMFEPFFTTKEMGKGTGQGLAIARSVIVEKLSGLIDFESVEGKGTTFTIRLPLQCEPAALATAMV